MDFNALQHKLFQMDPSDPAEDLRKLAAQANGGGNMDAPPTTNYLEESADVSKGSMPLDIASISDFAALAGVVTEGKQKTGSAGQAKGKDPMPKAKPGRTEHPLKDKLVGEDDRIAALESRVAQLEVMLAEATKDKVIKARDPNAQYMNDLRKSGAMGAHKDKKKDAKAGKQKHKGKAYESITDELWAMLREK